MNGQSTDESRTGLGPTVARLRLGNALRDLRERAGMTLDEAAKSLQRTAPTVSRLETGKTSKPRDMDIVMLLDAYARRGSGIVSEQARRDVLALVFDARRDVWFNEFRDVLSGEMVTEDARKYIELENDAVRVQSYELELIPGLLQTRDYIAAITTTYYPDATPEQCERFIELRTRRKDVLDRRGRPLELHVVLNEMALRRAPGGAQVQRAQLDALRELIRGGRPNVTVQVAPLELSIPAVIGGPFVVMTFDKDGPDDLVYLEGRTGAIYQQAPDQLATYRKHFSDLTAAAHDASASLTAIEEAIGRLDK